MLASLPICNEVECTSWFNGTPGWMSKHTSTIDCCAHDEFGNFCGHSGDVFTPEKLGNSRFCLRFDDFWHGEADVDRSALL